MSALENLFGLKDRVAVVTGASSGLGVEFAEALASAGASVALFARREQQLAAVAKKLEHDHGVQALPVCVDITDREALEQAFAQVKEQLGCVNILVNNAGVSPTGRAERQWPDAWDDALALNLSAVFHCCILAAGQMRESGRGGRIINITSIFGRLGSSLFRLAAYTATKGGAENLTRQLAAEWAVDGITVNAIAPAWFASEMTAESLEKGDIQEKMAAGNPTHRIGRPGELKTACLFLAAPASSYVTGAVIPVDGGHTCW